MPYPTSYVTSFTYSGDIQTKLKGITFMTDRSKKLFEYACKPDVAKFAETLTKFVWLGTRDTTMVLMVTFILALAQKCNDEDFKNCLREMDSTELKNVFNALGKGDGQTAKKKLEKIKMFKKLFVDIILSQAIKAKDGDEKAKVKALKQREDKWTDFLKQVGKIKKWKVSYSTVENNVIPILYKILPTIFAKAFKDGFNNLPLSKEIDSPTQVVELKLGRNLRSDEKILVGVLSAHFGGGQDFVERATQLIKLLEKMNLSESVPEFNMSNYIQEIDKNKDVVISYLADTVFKAKNDKAGPLMKMIQDDKECELMSGPLYDMIVDKVTEVEEVRKQRNILINKKAKEWNGSASDKDYVLNEKSAEDYDRLSISKEIQSTILVDPKMEKIKQNLKDIELENCKDFIYAHAFEMDLDSIKDKLDKWDGQGTWLKVLSRRDVDKLMDDKVLKFCRQSYDGNKSDFEKFLELLYKGYK